MCFCLLRKKVNTQKTFVQCSHYVFLQGFLFHFLFCESFKRQQHKMVKHTQTIRRQQPTNCLSVLDHFVGLPLKGITHF